MLIKEKVGLAMLLSCLSYHTKWAVEMWHWVHKEKVTDKRMFPLELGLPRQEGIGKSVGGGR